MKWKHVSGGLLLAPVAALLLATMPGPAVADPPFTPPGQAGRGVPPGVEKFGRGSFCPPGLAKKNPECMPPGQYKKFQRGDIIPEFLPFRRLDHRDFGLRAPGPGRRYIRLGDDAYLVSEGTRRVLEAISLFGAATR